jgi:hypothetical protein
VPSRRRRHAAFLGQHAIAAIAVDLKDSGEACEMSHRTLSLPIWGIHIGDARRVASLPRPVVAGIGPKLAGLGPAAAGIEHRRGGFVSEEFW